MEQLYEQANNDTSILNILDYLKKKSENDEVFKSKLNNEKKNVEEMMQFIFGKAKAKANENVAIIQDNEVYGWAIHYFDEDNLVVKNNEYKAKVSSTKKDKPVKEKKNEPKETPKLNNISLFDF